ncbi:hypothetical protein DPEC_G00090350 [Dallia pectoralis]|uniref:Uncharacterized protein n=1 Tax=Dallia pectoralis TaxID=75939 RepID=A0ACC2H1M3_DALPE|nr:hypothetical protein DPEC_G00090350 [Dallia pectoralis]
MRSAHRHGLLSKDKKTSPATIVPPPQDLPAETSTQVPTSCPSLSYKMPKTKSCSNIATDIVSETLSYSHDKVCQTLNSIQNARTKSEGMRTSSHEDIVNEVTQREENARVIIVLILHLIKHKFFEKVPGLIERHSTSQQLLDPAGSETSKQPRETAPVKLFTQEFKRNLLQECPTLISNRDSMKKSSEELPTCSMSSDSVISAEFRGSPIDHLRNSLPGTPIQNEWPVGSDVPIIRHSFIDMVQSQTCSKVSPNKSKETITTRVETVKEDNQRDEEEQKRLLHLFAHELVDKVSGLIKSHSTSQQLLVPVGKAVSDTTQLKVKTGLEPSQQPWESELVNSFTQESVGRLLQECIISNTSSSPSSVTKLSSDNTLGSEKASPARIPKAVQKKKRSAHRYRLLSKRSKKVKMKTHNQEETSFKNQIPADSKPAINKNENTENAPSSKKTQKKKRSSEVGVEDVAARSYIIMITCDIDRPHHYRTDMRDRLSHLQKLSHSNNHVEQMDYAEEGESVSGDSFSNIDLEEETAHQAVVWDNTPELEEVFSKSQEVHREVQLIRLEIKRLREQNARVLQGTTSMSILKRDSNAIAADIKVRAEGVLSHLKDMDTAGQKLEAEHGTNAALTRIARTQYACLSNGFRDTMFDYNEAEMNHRENCKAHIQRQMEIAGREVTSEEVEDIIETGQWNVFNENILSEGKTARSALNQIESRHRDLVELESRIQSIHAIFLDVALLVEEQGPMMNTIQNNVQNTDAAVQEVLMKLAKAKRYSKNNPFKKMFCSCFPCVD